MSSAGRRTRGTGSPPAPSRGTRSNAAPNLPAAIASWTGSTSPTWPTSAIRSWRRIPTARSRSPSIRAPAGASPSLAYFYGYKAVGTLVYAWPDAYRKAQAADRVLRQRLADLGLRFEAILTEFVGVDATHGPLALAAGAGDDAPEVQLRIGVRSTD